MLKNFRLFSGGEFNRSGHHTCNKQNLNKRSRQTTERPIHPHVRFDRSRLVGGSDEGVAEAVADDDKTSESAEALSAAEVTSVMDAMAWAAANLAAVISRSPKVDAKVAEADDSEEDDEEEEEEEVALPIITAAAAAAAATSARVLTVVDDEEEADDGDVRESKEVEEMEDEETVEESEDDDEGDEAAAALL